DTDYDSAYIDEAHAILWNALTAEERAAPPVYDHTHTPPAPADTDATGAETETERGMVNVWDIVQLHIDEAKHVIGLSKGGDFRTDSQRIEASLTNAIQIIANHLKMKGKAQS